MKTEEMDGLSYYMALCLETRENPLDSEGGRVDANFSEDKEVKASWGRQMVADMSIYGVDSLGLDYLTVNSEWNDISGGNVLPLRDCGVGEYEGFVLGFLNRSCPSNIPSGVLSLSLEACESSLAALEVTECFYDTVFTKQERTGEKWLALMI